MERPKEWPECMIETEISCGMRGCLNNLGDKCYCRLDEITPNDPMCKKLITKKESYQSGKK